MRWLSSAPLGAQFGRLALTLGLHPLEHRFGVLLRQIGPAQLDVDDRHADALGLLIDLSPDLLHQLGPVVAHHFEEAGIRQHRAHRRRQERVEALIAALHGANTLVEAHRIDDAIAGEGVDHQTLLVRRDQLLRIEVEIENALVEIFDVLDQRDLEIEARLDDGAPHLTELQHERLRRRRHDEGRAGDDDQEKRHEDAENAEESGLHGWPPVRCVLGRASWSSGSRGRTPPSPLP